MLKLLRIGAVICMALAVLISFRNLRGGSFFEHGLVVSRKYTSEVDSRIQFRLYSEPFPQGGGAYDAAVSHDFYDAARIGDSIRSPLTGYLQLVRDGRVVARYFSQDFVVSAVYMILGLLPTVAFLKFGSSPFLRIIFALIGLLEVVVIGAFLYGTFVPCC